MSTDYAKLFPDLSAEQRQQIVENSRTKTFEAGSYLMEEGEASTEFFILESGSAVVEVIETTSEDRIVVSTLNAGEIVGEMALLDNGPRSASVRAIEPVEARVISVEPDTLIQNDLASRLILNLGTITATRLRAATEVQAATIQASIDESAERIEMGNFLGKILICTFLYTFTLCALKGLSEVVPATTFVTIPILMMFGGVIFYIIRTSRYPLSDYGLTTDGAGPAIREAILFSLPVLGLVVVIKWLLIQFAPSMSGMDLFGLSVIRFTHDPEITFGLTVAVIGGYLFFSPIQEFIVRCGMQSSFQKFLNGRYKGLVSIVLSTMLFSSTHLHVSLILATIVFPLGLFWGWLYSRHPTLVGVSTSHMLIGFFGLFIVEFPTTDS